MFAPPIRLVSRSASLQLPENKKWLPLALSQNPRFVPLVIESGGRLGDATLGFIERLSYSAGGSPSDRAAITTYALQCIRARTVKGTAALS